MWYEEDYQLQCDDILRILYAIIMSIYVIMMSLCHYDYIWQYNGFMIQRRSIIHRVCDNIQIWQFTISIWHCIRKKTLYYLNIGQVHDRFSDSTADPAPCHTDGHIFYWQKKNHYRGLQHTKTWGIRSHCFNPWTGQFYLQHFLFCIRTILGNRSWDNIITNLHNKKMCPYLFRFFRW